MNAGNVKKPSDSSATGAFGVGNGHKADLTQDMHLKMSKKIAQLTKVM